MTAGPLATLVVAALFILFVVTALVRAVRVVPQASSVLVERLGRYSRTLDAGLHFLVPFVDKPRATVDLREQVVSFPPQPVITSDNLVVSIDTVIYFQPTDPKAAVYEIANYIQGIEQLTVTTLRNVIGSLDLEETLTSRDQINAQLRGVLDEATGRWGIRVNRVELKAIDPPHSVQDSMEKQMRAERDRRATILNAEGVKQSQILTAEGDKQSSILRAEGQAQAAILQAQGQARAIEQVFEAIHQGNPDSKLLAYQYLQMLPQIAQGPANKIWIVPTELTQALRGIGQALGGAQDGDTPWSAGSSGGGSGAGLGPPLFDIPQLEDPAEALTRARAEADAAAADAQRNQLTAPVTRAPGLPTHQPPPAHMPPPAHRVPPGPPGHVPPASGPQAPQAPQAPSAPQAPQASPAAPAPPAPPRWTEPPAAPPQP